jgi:hypothetical protein
MIYPGYRGKVARQSRGFKRFDQTRRLALGEEFRLVKTQLRPDANQALGLRSSRRLGPQASRQGR